MLTLFIKTRESLTLAGGEGASPRGPYTFPGILARLRAMASSTALSCFRSSSRRDSVLAFPDLVPVETAVAVPASEALPGTLVTLLELLDWGDSWRFLSGGATGALEFWPLCRSGFGEPSLPPDLRSREPRSGDKLARLAGGGLCLSLSEGSYRFRLPLSAALFSSVSLISLWATNEPCWGCPGGACWGAAGCGGFPPAEGFEDLGSCAEESLFRLSSLTPSSFLDFPFSFLVWAGVGDRELAEDTGLARSAYMSSESTLCTELLLDVALDTEETLLTLRDLDLELEPL